MAFGIKSVALGLLATSVVITAPAQAAACWSSESVAAAKVRDLETMLMVSALRCRTSGQDFLSKYNSFVRASRTPLTVANDRLRAHFAAGLGATAGLNAYDRYVTSLANRYGAGAEGLSCRDMASITDAALREGTSFANLERLAVRAEVSPVLHGGMCRTVVAHAR